MSNKKFHYQESPSNSIQQSFSNKNGIIQKEKMIKHYKLPLRHFYKILNKIGEGSFGQVYKVVHKNLKAIRAMKVISKIQKPQYNSYQQLEILKQLDHPSILKIYQYFETDDKWYIITEYFQGKQLFDMIISQNCINQKNTALIVFQILKALVHIHSKKIAHRDIKAENVLVQKSKEGYSVKLIDWGLGALVSKQLLLRKCGTPQYCAPEIFKGKYDERCDMWSLGILVYIMLSGYMPFKGQNIAQTLLLSNNCQLNFNHHIWEKISLSAKSFIVKLIQKNPNLRMNASQAIKHKWICQQIQQSQEQKCKTLFGLKETLERMKEVNIQNKFQIAVISFIHNYISSAKEQLKLKRQFQLLDENHDGVLSYEELLKGYIKICGQLEAEKIVQNIFRTLDLNGSKSIQYSQFITFAIKMKRKFKANQLKEAFNLFDKDNNGYITKKQILSVIKYQKTRSDQIQSVIDSMDSNQDGTINFEQFLQSLNNSIEKSFQKQKQKKSQQKQKKSSQKQKKSQKKQKQIRKSSMKKQKQYQKVTQQHIIQPTRNSQEKVLQSITSVQLLEK